LWKFCYPEWRNWCRRKVIIHFDNASLHNTKRVEVQKAFSKFQKMKSPTDSLDLALCDFFLFGYLNGQLRDEPFHEESELLRVILEIIGEFQCKCLRRCLRNGWVSWSFVLILAENILNKHYNLVLFLLDCKH
jgi:hypothetical protein